MPEKKMGMTGLIADSFKDSISRGIGYGIGNVVTRFSLPIVARFFQVISSCTIFIRTVSSKGYNRMCNRPNPLSPDDVQVWENIFENIVSTACEQSPSNTLMLRNMRVQDEEVGTQVNDNSHWHFHVNFIDATLNHIIDSLEGHLPYYEGGSNQCGPLVGLANSLSTYNGISIVFMTKTIIANLRHIIKISREAESCDDLDTVHIKKLSRSTLLLFKKLRVLLCDETKQEKGTVLPELASLDAGSGNLFDY